jgi:hypothetical protein
MSAYENALRLYREAAASRKDAQDSGDGQRITAAQAEVDATARVMDRFAIDPYYQGPRRLERVSIPPVLGSGAAMYLPVTETTEAAR